MDFILYPVMLIASLAIILFACELFTNGIEWIGKKLDLSHGATGSVLAAVGTALPETSIPILALMSGAGASKDIAVGAIAGAPFMLATLGFFVTGAAVFIFAAKGRRSKVLTVDLAVKERDLGFFLVIYTVAVLTTFIPAHGVRLAIAACLASSYLFYMYLSLKHEGESHGDLDELHFTKYFKLATKKRFILLQLLVSLTIIAAGAHFFVVAVEHVSGMFGVPALILSLIVTPIATELPEKMNSVLWIKEGKDTLALGNITGAMVFQASFPVAIGVAFTPWDLRGPTMVSALIAIISAAICFIVLKVKRKMPPQVLLIGGALYLVFMAYLFTR
ncbi:MAG TPA: sodium:calcium antiporter [Nitrospirota bacterium]